MSMIFQFRMLCDEDDYFLREYEVPYDMTLAAFRDFINKDLQYRPEELTSFFTADDRWNKLQEFTARRSRTGNCCRRRWTARCCRRWFVKNATG